MTGLVQNLLEDSADRDPGRPAAWHKGEWLTYGELEDRANRLARFLTDQGLAPGGRVGVLLENGFAFPTAHFAVAKADCVNVSLNTEVNAEGLAFLLSDCEAEALILGPQHARLLAWPTPPKGLRLILWNGDSVPDFPSLSAHQGSSRIRHVTLAEACAASSPRPAPRRTESDLASLVYTSGSTGRPKGVMLTHRNLMSNTESIAGYLDLSPEDRVLTVLPFYYVYGQSLFYTHFLRGGSVIIDNRFAYPNVVLDTMAAMNATGFAGVPSTLVILLEKSTLRKRAFPSLRYVTQAGGHLSAAWQVKAVEAFAPARFFVMYGATEAAPRLTFLDPDRLPEKAGSIGKAIPGVEVFIADEAGNGMPRGTLGEIAARGPNIMAGYWRDPKGTAEVLRNGLYFTGDLGREDAEGFLFIEGRSRDFIKVGGNRVGAREIEDAILEWDGALEAAVIGVEDPLLGEVPKAFVVLKESKGSAGPGEPSGPGDLEGLKAFLKARFATYKQPKYYQALAALPKNGAGKVMKAELRKAGAAGASGAAGA
jgi:long-chain acyl-CoA synthetase